MSICLKKRLALMCLFCLIVTSLCGTVFAAEEIEEEAGLEPTVELALIPLYVDGIRVGDGYLLDGTTYVPVQAFSEAMGRDVEVDWDEEAETMSVALERDVEIRPKTEEQPAEETAEAVDASETAEIDETEQAEVKTERRSLHMTVKAGDAYIAANDRCFYAKAGIRYLDKVLMAPIRSLAAVFDLEVTWHDDTCSVSIDSRELDVLEAGETFYNEEDLYWLSHIIYAESGNQPLEGMIAVGNVVLNRVKDPTCPDTVYDVIFDRRYGVQFSPTENGTIYDEPNELSIVAAKLCLEGYNEAGDSLFFVNPEIGISSWFLNTRTYVATIGQHVFFA